ncbi:DUF2975 domain-containing protein [uncultured Limosilactobacillus sp.]|uniref:DUF2975 domain-containing protein n=1 Tax=uncultured Limosilactobacillus sp. TaxID=2837629 RepID=UPI0025942C2B|nr:DUF2975 domain-containing protein [uncultured Limosilactobacillus sp.]
MKKRLTSWLLTIIQAVVDLEIVIVAVGAFGGLIAAPFTEIGHAFFDYRSGFGLLVQVLDVVLEVGLLVISLLGTRNLLSNINDGQYFVGQNMLAVWQILWSTLLALVLGGLNTVIYHLLHLRDKLGLLTMSGDDFTNGLGFVTVIFLIYLIFRRGVALQQEADEII